MTDRPNPPRPAQVDWPALDRLCVCPHTAYMHYREIERYHLSQGNVQPDQVTIGHCSLCGCQRFRDRADQVHIDRQPPPVVD